MSSDNQILNILTSKNNNYDVKRKFHIIRDKNGIRWLIEKDTLIIKVLNEWRPYKTITFIMWKIIILLIQLRVLRFLPFSKVKDLFITRNLWFRNKYSSSFEDLSFVCYIGRKTKGQQKSTIFIFDKKKKKCIFTVKKAINQKAWPLIKNEFNILKKLEEEKNQFSPKIYSIDHENYFIVQEYIMGEPSPIKLNFFHYELLASLINKDKFLDLSKIKLEIEDYLFEKKKLRNLDKKVFLKKIQKALKFSIWEKEIQSVRIHGDFAPWNLKYTKEKNKIMAYDWEESIESYLPFYDLIYYKFSVKKLLNKSINIKLDEYTSLLINNGFFLNDNLIYELLSLSEILVLIKLNKDC